MMLSGVHKRLTVNSVSNVARYFASVVVALILTPFIVHTLGESLYGTWIIVMSFIGYASVLEFGVQPGIVKLVAEFRAKDDRHGLNGTIVSGFAFFTVIGFVGAVLFVLVVPGIANLVLKTKEALPYALFVILAVDLLLVFYVYVYSGILFGLQLYHPRNVIEVAALLLNAVLIVIFLERGGLVALAATKAISDLVRIVAMAVVVRRVLPGIRLRSFKERGPAFRRLIRFGGAVFAGSTMVRAWEYSQPLIIGIALSSAWASFFAIPKRLVEYAKELIWAMTTGFLPMFSDLDARKEFDEVRNIYVRYTRYILLAICPGLVFAFVFGEGFLNIWMGPEFGAKGGGVLRLLVAAHLVQGLQPLFWRLFLGVEKLKLLVWLSVSVSVLGIAASIALVGPLGIEGIAWAVVIVAAMRAGVHIRYASSFLKIRFTRLIRQTLVQPLGLSAVFGILLLLVNQWIKEPSYLALGLIVLAGMPVYLALGYWFGLDGEERRAVWSLVRRLAFSKWVEAGEK